MPELGAVSVPLPAEDGDEDEDDDVVGPVLGVLDDGVSDEEDGSEVLGAVAGQQEGDSSVLDGVSQNGLGSVVLARVVDLLGFDRQGSQFALQLFVLGVLTYISMYGLDFGDFRLHLGSQEVDRLLGALVHLGDFSDVDGGGHHEEG